MGSWEGEPYRIKVSRSSPFHSSSLKQLNKPFSYIGFHIRNELTVALYLKKGTSYGSPPSFSLSYPPFLILLIDLTGKVNPTDQAFISNKDRRAFQPWASLSVQEVGEYLLSINRRQPRPQPRPAQRMTSLCRTWKYLLIDREIQVPTHFSKSVKRLIKKKV